jgi:hypothetical protein
MAESKRGHGEPRPQNRWKSVRTHVVFQTDVLISGRSHTASHNLSTGVPVNHPDVDAISKSAHFGRLPGQIQDPSNQVIMPPVRYK